MENLNIPKPKPPYWIGLLCLIPLLGAIVGFVMIIMGISRYRNKIFTWIGVAGILWTIGIYGSLFYAMRYSPTVRQGWAELSQMQLNELVKSIEFYKMQHGSYPDKLEDLREDSKTVMINDPILMSAWKNNSFYQYEKNGDHYSLFSVGVDGIAHTKDDLYPQIKHIEHTGLKQNKTTDSLNKNSDPLFNVDGYYIPQTEIADKKQKLEWVSVFIHPGKNDLPAVQLRLTDIKTGKWTDVLCPDYTITKDSISINYSDKKNCHIKINGSFKTMTHGNERSFDGTTIINNTVYTGDFAWSEGD